VVTKSAELPTETYLGSQQNKTGNWSAYWSLLKFTTEQRSNYLTTGTCLGTQYNRVAADTFLLLPMFTSEYSMARNPSSQANSFLDIKKCLVLIGDKNCSIVQDLKYSWQKTLVCDAV
jgi:hypothetical protein